MKGPYWFLLISIFLGERFHLDPRPDEKRFDHGYYTSKDFESIDKIDAHVHLRTTDSAFARLAKEKRFRVLTISTDEAPGVERQNEWAIQQCQAFPNVVSYVTTFSVANLDKESWKKKTITSLQRSFASGAIAVKLYKNIGMELRDEQGTLIMISDGRFDPILDFLERENIPLIGHFGEPKNCWLAVEDMTIEGDRRYYIRHPEFHMYRHPALPSYEAQLEAKDNMLHKHPKLTFIGAHLGSLEWSLDALAAHLDSFPMASVDMAARVSHIQLHAQGNWRKTRDFFIKYQDRILYATDLIIDEEMDDEEMKRKVLDKWKSDWAFFSSDEALLSPSFNGGFKGLKLPKEVIDKLYRLNAEKAFFFKP